MKLKLEIHVLSPDGTPIELSLEEAKELYTTLHELFGPKDLSEMRAHL